MTAGEVLDSYEANAAEATVIVILYSRMFWWLKTALLFGQQA